MNALVIEDDTSLNEIICACLAGEGYACTSAFSGSEARLLLQADAASFDLVITDLMLPGCPGEELVPLARRRLGNVPVIVVSAKATVDDRVALLRTGADDYLVKPFDLDELLARVDAQTRARGGAARMHDEVLRFGAWELSPEQRTFAVDGVPLRLTRTEFDLLAALMAHPDRVFTKRDLYLIACRDDAQLADVASGAVPVMPTDEKTIVTHMGNLRTKLKPTGTDGYLETVWGIGFKLRRA